MKHSIKSIAIGAALFTFAGIGCSSDDSGPLGNVESLIILQRAKRNDGGDIFQYTSYLPGAKISQLSPPTADGKLTTICCTQDPDFAKADISGYDISFDAKSIVFSAKLNDNQRYGLFLLQLADGSITQVPTDPGRDYVSPIFLPGDRILYMTNAIVEPGAPQHQDEYERGTTTQMGRMDLTGGNVELGPRNLSHRSFPSLTSDGRVVFTQWDHLGGENSGHLMFMSQDMQNLREGFGKEGSGISNSIVKATEIAPGRLLAIATARSRTLSSGELIDIRLGTPVENHDGIVSAPSNQSEANSTVRELTPDVPNGEEPAAQTIGRYYDAVALNAKEKPDLLASWSDGPVESGVLSSAGLTPDFGIYLFSSETQQRRPIFNDPEMWDIFARPLTTRTAPNVVSSAQDPKLGNQMMIGSLDVYNSTLAPQKVADGEIYGVRVMEGFSSEEGAPRMFGTTMFEGHANLGVAPIENDHSWSALVPANVPLHLQTVDKFGMSLFNEGFWFSGRAGEARVCGGCHEDRARTTNVTPGLLETFARGATPMFGTTPRKMRANPAPATAKDVVGVPWSTVVQQIFNDNCTSCHNGTPGAANPSYTITDTTTGQLVATWTFDLRDQPVPAALTVAAGGASYSASYFSVAGPDPEAIEKGHLMLGPGFKVYMTPMDARGSEMIKKINPTQLFPNPSTLRAFAGNGHLAEQGKPELSARDQYILILAADMGVLYYSRENLPGNYTF
ncbi:MAG TPA: hypothetical protein VLM79_31400 [Kofleriaceae bacterium]|nr:hypothetical protein [Kofleriaceae bacterium]